MLTGATGDVKTFAINDIFLTIRIKDHSSEVVPPFSQVEDMATRYARLAKAPPAQIEIAAIYQKSKPVFDNPKYERYFEDIERTTVPTGFSPGSAVGNGAQE
jgi:hypothetical protein